jgi:hypothetical protein
MIFAGDLVDDPDQPDAYLTFLEDFFLPVTIATGISESKVFFVPGNHDVSRKSVSHFEAENHGLWSSANDQEWINRIYENQRSSAFVIDRQQCFFSTLEALDIARNHSNNRFVSRTDHEADEITLVGLNTAIFSMAGSYGDEQRKLSFPDVALNSAFESSPSNNTTIVVHHHPLDWMTEEAAREMRTTLQHKAHVHIFGHLHEAEPKLERTPGGSLVSIQLPSLFSTRKHLNGYCIVSLARPDNHVRTTFRTYWDGRRRFDKATNITDEGVFFPTEAGEAFFLSSAQRLSYQKMRKWIVDFVRPHVTPTLEESHADKALSSIFVEPPLVRKVTPKTVNDETDLVESEEAVSLQKIAHSDSNYFIFVPPEFGRTSLARGLAATVLGVVADGALSDSDSRPRAPVIIDLNETKLYEANILRRIREWLPEASSLGHTSQSLVSQGFITLIFDNVSTTDEHAFEALANLYPGCQYIHLLKSPLNFGAPATLKIPHDDTIDRIEVRPLTRRLVRKLVENWQLDKSYDTNSVVEQIIARFRLLSIPLSPVNVAIFLTVAETIRGFTPINTASLIENYIDVVLEKYDLKSAFRSSFDYKNKVDYLSYIAKTMVARDEYRYEYESLYEASESYFKDRLLSQRAQEVIDYFVGAKIFETVGNNIQFRLNIFQAYFIAHAMILDGEFKNDILNKFTSFGYEIDIYCGLARDDGAVIDRIGNGYQEILNELFRQVPAIPRVGSLDSFVLPTDKSAICVLKRVTDLAFSSKLDQNKRDKLLDGERTKPSIGAVHQRLTRPDVRSVLVRWVLALRAYSSCLKNLELIDGAKKEQHLKPVLDGWAQGLVFAIFVLTTLFEDKEIELGKIKLRSDVDLEAAPAYVLRYYFLIVPTVISYYLRNDLGSEKLDLILRQEDSERPTSVEFIRACLFLDLRLDEYTTVVKRIVRKIHKNNFLLEALVLKVRDFYLRNTLSEVDDSAIRKLMVDLFQLISGEGSAEASSQKASNRIQSLRRKKIIREIRSSVLDSSGF